MSSIYRQKKIDRTLRYTRSTDYAQYSDRALIEGCSETDRQRGRKKEREREREKERGRKIHIRRDKGGTRHPRRCEKWSRKFEAKKERKKRKEQIRSITASGSGFENPEGLEFSRQLQAKRYKRTSNRSSLPSLSRLIHTIDRRIDEQFEKSSRRGVGKESN